VINKSPVRVILTAPPADWRARKDASIQEPPPADEEPALAPEAALDAEAEETLARLENRFKPGSS
jgi:hypothetical protein